MQINLRSVFPVLVMCCAAIGGMYIVEPGRTGHVSVQALPNQVVDGTVTRTSWALGPNRTLRTEIDLPNPDGVLRPGMYGNATLRVGTPHAVLAVPSTAISYNTFGDFVYVVEPREHGALVAVARTVQVGETRDGLTEIASGLKAGERVVTAGQVKLHDGTPVSVASGSAG